MSEYLRPQSMNEALSYLAETRATIAAGCTDLFAATGRRDLTGPVLDVTAIEGLRGITASGAGLSFGAATTWGDVIRADLPPAFDMLKEAAREVGSVQIQNAGTIAGNICNASPAADGVPCLVALDAQVTLASQSGTRVLPLAGFLTGPRQTDLRADEMVVSIDVPGSAMSGRSRFLKLGARRYLVISIAMVAVRLTVEAGKVRDVAIGVGACGPVARRMAALEEALLGRSVGDMDMDMRDLVTEGMVAPALAPIDDIRAAAGYRTHAAVELIRRALADLLFATEVAA